MPSFFLNLIDLVYLVRKKTEYLKKREKVHDVEMSYGISVLTASLKGVQGKNRLSF